MPIQKKILVTGGTGMVGRSLYDLIDSLQEQNYLWLFLSSKICDLTKREKCEELFNDYKPDIVIHLASRVGGLYDNMKHNYNFYITNNMINNNILYCCEKFNVKSLISILSTCIYGDNIEISENNIHDVPPHNSNKGYAYSKRILDIGTELLSNKNNVKCINIIPSNLYGIYDNYNEESSHVVAALLSRIYNAKRSNSESIEIYGSGIAKRQFLNSFDLAKVILEIVQEKIVVNNQFKRIIVSGNREISIKELVDIIVKKVEYNGRIIYNLEYPDGQLRKYAKDSELLNNFEFTLLEKGISDIIDKWDEKN